MKAPSVDFGTLLTLAVLVAVAFREWRLLRENRRKVLAEASDLSTQAADRMLEHWEKDNERLRTRLDRVERRCDRLERLLREHDIPVPSFD